MEKRNLPTPPSVRRLYVGSYTTLRTWVTYMEVKELMLEVNITYQEVKKVMLTWFNFLKFLISVR